MQGSVLVCVEGCEKDAGASNSCTGRDARMNSSRAAMTVRRRTEAGVGYGTKSRWETWGIVSAAHREGAGVVVRARGRRRPAADVGEEEEEQQPWRAGDGRRP